MKRLSLLTSALALLGVFALTGLPNRAAADKEPDKKPAKKVVVVMETSKGTIEIELNTEKAPITVKNFLSYVDDKFYDKTIFHRVIGNFMIQGGGFTTELKEKKTKATIKNEASNGLSNVRGTIAMARLNDPDTATAQFFINVKDNKGLDKAEGKDGYAVFGKVIKGMDVVDKIKGVKTGEAKAQVLVDGKHVKDNFEDVPVENVVIKSVRRKKEK
jgi:cyclophilin family peptidyl-prolyl cis-trans isomerase